MTSSPPPPPHPQPGQPADEPGADLALYALDALDDAEARTVETLLATDAAAAGAEARLRRAAGAIAAAAPAIDTTPPLDLRDRVLAAARAERAPAPHDLAPTTPAELHRIQGDQLVELLRSLTPADWSAPVDPPEFAGWTVADLVAHLATVEAYLADQLGARIADLPERVPVNEDRTTAAIVRHRSLRPTDAVAELERCLAAVDDDVERSGEPARRPIEWWGSASSVDRILVVRSFELWIHAADIARAVGLAEPVPSAPSLRCMSDLATTLTPLMCEIAGTLPPTATDGWVRFELTGPGGATHDVPLAVDAAAPLTGEPVASLTIGIVDYCRAVAKRVEPGQLGYGYDGDAAVAAAVVASLPALAVL